MFKQINNHSKKINQNFYCNILIYNYQHMSLTLVDLSSKVIKNGSKLRLHIKKLIKVNLK